jgi:hypothetical protein
MKLSASSPASALQRILTGTLVTVLAIGGFSCRLSPLENSFGSPEALAEAVLNALEQEDRGSMLALMVTSEEHQSLLWDQLPESNHLTFEYARDLNERNSGKAITSAISRFGGNEFELLSIQFTEDAEIYEHFTLHFGTVLRVRRTSDGMEGTLPILDVVLEYDGRWKLMNYDE